MKQVLIAVLFLLMSAASLQAEAYFCSQYSEPSEPFCLSDFHTFSSESDFYFCKEELMRYARQIDEYVKCLMNKAYEEVENDGKRYQAEAERKAEEKINYAVSLCEKELEFVENLTEYEAERCIRNKAELEINLLKQEYKNKGRRLGEEIGYRYKRKIEEAQKKGIEAIKKFNCKASGGSYLIGNMCSK
ncbi:MAG: hypothetical protein J6M05_06375 [Cardiobacteriaceae bacterium]|nr:hypothetical protein [Cardiobacteriaceae bacterium]